jgi:hypothetical protein
VLLVCALHVGALLAVVFLVVGHFGRAVAVLLAPPSESWRPAVVCRAEVGAAVEAKKGQEGGTLGVFLAPAGTAGMSRMAQWNNGTMAGGNKYADQGCIGVSLQDCAGPSARGADIADPEIAR